MSRPAKMALGGAAVMVALAFPAAAVAAYYFGSMAAWAFLYGVFVGVAMFSSIAFAVTMVFGPTTEMKRLAGAGIYVGRLVFAAAAMLVPIILGLWPIMPMVGGIVGVYIVESVALLVGAWRMSGEIRVHKVREVGEMERRAS